MAIATCLMELFEIIKQELCSWFEHRYPVVVLLFILESLVASVVSIAAARLGREQVILLSELTWAGRT